MSGSSSTHITRNCTEPCIGRLLNPHREPLPGSGATVVRDLTVRRSGSERKRSTNASVVYLALRPAQLAAASASGPVSSVANTSSAGAGSSVSTHVTLSASGGR